MPDPAISERSSAAGPTVTALRDHSYVSRLARPCRIGVVSDAGALPVPFDEPEPSTSVTESWNSADSTCQFDGSEYTVDARNPFESDLGSVLSGVFDIVVPSGNAQLAGTEQVAGVDAKHYTFTIEGLGAGSGAQIDDNTGDVWVASDGGYLLKYVVSAAMRSGPADAATSEQYSISLTLELTSVNQPVAITPPADCAA
jgi:hypothetical protein